jgi:MFS family permease
MVRRAAHAAREHVRDYKHAMSGFTHNASRYLRSGFLQGVGGGMLTPVGTAMLFRAFPPHERAKASTILMIPMVVAPASGPVLGG